MISPDFRLLEDITFENVERYKSSGIELIDAAESGVSVDLGGLAKPSSVAVALLLGWYRHASLTGKSIVFANMSRDLHNIIEVSGLKSPLLELETH